MDACKKWECDHCIEIMNWILRIFVKKNTEPWLKISRGSLVTLFCD